MSDVVTTAGTAPARPEARRFDRGWTTVVVVALAVLGAVITFFRVPQGQHDIVWAEDANIFLAEALDRGPFAVLFEGYAGYQHLIPRIAAAFILTFAPLQSYAIAVSVVCAIVTGLVAAAVYVLSGSVVPWWPARIGVASITVLIPLSAQEVIGNLADFHAFAMWLAVWLVFSTPGSRWAGWAWAVVAFLSAMTEVQTLVLLAVIPFRLRRTDRPAWPIFGALIAGWIWQIATVLTVQRESGADWIGATMLAKGWLVNVVLPLFNPDIRSELQLIGSTGVWVPLLVAGVLVVGAGVGVVYGTRLQRLLLIGLLLASTGLYVVSITANGSWLTTQSGDPTIMLQWMVNTRYGVVPGMLLAATVPIVVGIVVRRFDRPVIKWVGVTVIAAMIAVFAVADVNAGSSRGSAAQWSDAVEEASEQCESDAPDDPAPPLPVAPDRAVVLSCDDVLELTR